MRYAVLVPDGAADRPLAELGGQTPLAAAATPALDALAREGLVGTAANIPSGMEPGSDIATLSLLGYEPEKFYTGRAPLEAPAIGVELSAGEVALRVNLVTVAAGWMLDHSAGEITTPEAHEIVRDLVPLFERADVKLHAGVSYRHLMVSGEKRLLGVKTTPPHSIRARETREYLPAGEGAEVLLGLMDEARPILAAHPGNERRRVAGKREATEIWPWGQGTRPELPSFVERFGVRGGVISAVALLQSLALYLGMEKISVEGATGTIETNWRGKREAALEALGRLDLVLVHVEAPDEAGHRGEAAEKVRAIELFDRELAGPILEEGRRGGDLRILVLPDHPTPCAVGDHVAEPVPFAFWGPGMKADGAQKFDEETAATGLNVARGTELMPMLLERR